MLETTNELASQIRASLGASQKGKTTNEIVAEIRDAIANGVSGGMSEQDVRDIIAEIIDGAPEAFDTFKEIQDYLDTVYTKSQIDAALAGKANASDVTAESTARQNADTEILNTLNQVISSSAEIHIGTTEPTNSDVKVWIDTDDSQASTETDPTVPSWAKQPAPPVYTANDVGAIPIPASASSGAFLVYNGTAWVAQTLSTWQGGNY